LALIVQKFGGTSVANPERMRVVAERALKTQREGHQVVMIVSAMAGETNRLLALAHSIAPIPDMREMDALASTGEQVSAALVAITIQSLGGQATSLLGHQVKVQTDGAFTKARIQAIDDSRLLETVREGHIAVVAGFQGVDAEGNITTLGRGGSDTTAVAIAAAIRADVCEIYTDVDGVYTTDPNIVPSARKIDRISYEEMLELASLGAKVLQIRSVEVAMKYGVFRCTFARRSAIARVRWWSVKRASRASSSPALPTTKARPRFSSSASPTSPGSSPRSSACSRKRTCRWT
jgi:aspartate kinase